MKWYCSLAVVLALLCLQACTKEAVSIETVTVSDNPYLISVDTFQVKATVTRLDSFLTGNTSLVIAGYHNDPALGTTTSSAYLKFGLPSDDYNNVGTNQEAYDSIVFVAKMGKNYYGDTSVNYTVNLERLSEEIYREDEYYYNNTSFKANDGRMATISKKVRPSTGDSLRVKLSDAFGSAIFQFYREKNLIIRDLAEFQRWFKGIKMVPDQATSSALFSFATGDSSIAIHLYYHTDNAIRVTKRLSFYLGASGKQFSEINTNTTGTDFANLTPGKSFPAESLGNKYAIFPLGGIRTVFSFPSIKNLPTFGDFVQLLNARFVAYPSPALNYNLPDPLAMYFKKPDLSYEGPLANLSGTGSQTGNLVIDKLYGKDTYYSWDIGSYVTTEASATIYTERSLLPLADQPYGTITSAWAPRLVGPVNIPGALKLTTQMLIYQYQK